MIKLYLIIKDSFYDPIFYGTLDEFESVYFSFSDGSSIDNKLDKVRTWIKDNNYSLEIKDGSKIYA